MIQKTSLDALAVFFTKHPARFFLFAAILWMTIMGIMNNTNDIQWNDILVEANGMAFDLLVFGILLSIYEALREKRERVERLQEEIDDYRGWDEKEAMYRIVGAIKRLNKAEVSKIDLSDCFLFNANLTETNLAGANLARANLSRVNLAESNLAEARLSWANLSWANLLGANLFEANLLESRLLWADLSKANLSGAYLAEADLSGANLSGANLSGAVLSGAVLSGANLSGTDLSGTDLSRVDFSKKRHILVDLSEEDRLKIKHLGATISGTRDTLFVDLSGANLLGARVFQNWFEILEHYQVQGHEEIQQKYHINESGYLIENT